MERVGEARVVMLRHNPRKVTAAGSAAVAPPPSLPSVVCFACAGIDPAVRVESRCRKKHASLQREMCNGHAADIMPKSKPIKRAHEYYNRGTTLKSSST